MGRGHGDHITILATVFERSLKYRRENRSALFCFCLFKDGADESADFASVFLGCIDLAEVDDILKRTGADTSGNAAEVPCRR